MIAPELPFWMASPAVSLCTPPLSLYTQNIILIRYQFFGSISGVWFTLSDVYGRKIPLRIMVPSPSSSLLHPTYLLRLPAIQSHICHSSMGLPMPGQYKMSSGILSQLYSKPLACIVICLYMFSTLSPKTLKNRSQFLQMGSSVCPASSSGPGNQSKLSVNDRYVTG